MWDALARTVVLRTQLGEAGRKRTRVCIVDAHGGVIADKRLGHLQGAISLGAFARLIRCREGHVVTEFEGSRSIVACASSPGCETYATGWHSFIFQDLEVD